MTTNPRSLLDSYGIEPRKSLGQNFLHDPNMLEKITDAAELSADDVVVEVGPGTGALTVVLAQQVKHVHTVEVDERLRDLLESELAPYDNVSIHYADILKVNIRDLTHDVPYSVVANVPYYITSAIIRHFLETQQHPRRMVITMQTELAERIVAQPDDMSLLAVSVQFYGNPQIITRMKPAVFWPRPEVGSAVLRIDVYDQPQVDVPDSATFFRVVRAGFSQKRKQLKNAVGSGLGIANAEAAALLESAGIDPRRRAETLTLEEWAALTREAVGIL